jgi:glyoxylase-like metal-dependent hydrolase (beta-lactamase superfamily II)
VAAHAHLDHFGGMPAVLDAFDPAFVLEPGQPVPDAGYLGFLSAVESDGAAWRPRAPRAAATGWSWTG